MGGVQDSQNRTVRGWIKPSTRFSFDLWFNNLSNVELGALLWLLQLPEAHHLALGGGKPLGLGAVRLDVDWPQTRLRTGLDMHKAYADLDLATAAAGQDPAIQATMLIGKYQEAVQRTNGAGNGFTAAPHIAGFLRAASGHPDNLPTHYPRHTDAPHIDGENFKWFVANERLAGPKHALARLDNDPGLPMQGGN